MQCMHSFVFIFFPLLFHVSFLLFAWSLSTCGHQTGHSAGISCCKFKVAFRVEICAFKEFPLRLKRYVTNPLFLLFFFFSFFWGGGASLAAYGSSQAGDRIRAATATATSDPSHICELHHSSQQCQILHSLSEARDRTGIFMDTNQDHYC